MLTTREFAFCTDATPDRVYAALTDVGDQARYLQGVTIASTWTAGAPLVVRSGGDPRPSSRGDVLTAEPPTRLSFAIEGGNGPAAYLTWQVRSSDVGSIVRLSIDEVEGGDPCETEEVWLPVLASLQAMLAAEVAEAERAEQERAEQGLCPQPHY